MSKLKFVDKNKNILIKQIINELAPNCDYPIWIVLINIKKISSNFKIVVFSVYDDENLEYQGSITTKLEESDPKDQKWIQAKVGSEDFTFFTFSAREKSNFEKIKDFFKRSIEEGKFQDFLPF